MRSVLVPLALLAVVTASSAQDKPKDAPKFAGPTKDGFLLPNGWHLTPVGKHAVTTDLPLNVLPLKDNKHVLVATSGWNAHDLSVIDVSGPEPKVVSKVTVKQSWYGLAVNADESKVYWAGGGHGAVHTFDLKDGQLTAADGPAARSARCRSKTSSSRTRRRPR